MKMYNLITHLKSNLYRVPLPVGKILAKVPLSIIPGVGKTYKKQLEFYRDFSNYTIKKQQNFIFSRVRKMAMYAQENIVFYQDFYSKHNFDAKSLKFYEDLKQIPIINKTDLLAYPLEKRSNLNTQHFKANTGGSSGETLSFYNSTEEIVKEWASFHYIWGNQAGFNRAHLRLGISAQSRGENAMYYDFARHALILNMFKNYREVSKSLKKVLQKKTCLYLHGYPSSFFDFAEFCENEDHELRDLLRRILKGIFLCSEHPLPHYRDRIEQVFQVKSFIHYGHTERCVLACEREERLLYYALQPYGYAEAEYVDGKLSLIGTSYMNFASPLIRYNTKDLIADPQYNDGNILTTFRVAEGRIGDFIQDRQNRAIALTGLIFGRHHKMFDWISHMQIAQKTPGTATIYYVPNTLKNKSIPDDISQYFNSEGLDMDFKFCKLDAPIKASSGKVLLKVNTKN